MRRIAAGRYSLVLALAAAVAVSACKRKPAPQPIDVEISGTALPLTITPDPVEVFRGDQVQWTHAGADSIVIFLDDVYADPPVARAGRDAAATISIKPDAPYRRFKYSVQVFVGNQGVLQDPEIIVKPGG